MWDLAFDVDREHRAYDDPHCGLPQFGLPPVGSDDDFCGHLSRPLVEGDVAASFAAIESYAGYFFRTLSCSPDNRTIVESALVISDHLEDLARGLKVALRMRLEELDNDDEEGTTA